MMERDDFGCDDPKMSDNVSSVGPDESPVDHANTATTERLARKTVNGVTILVPIDFLRVTGDVVHREAMLDADRAADLG